MNLDTYEKLKINHLNTSFVPTLKGATGHDMLTRGIRTFDFTINEHTFTNSFIVCTKIIEYRPQANGCIEGFHKFLKACISKHRVNNLEWDDILPLAATAYNWFPNEH